MTGSGQFKKGLSVILATLMVFTMLPGGLLQASTAGTLNITQTDGTGGYTKDSDGNITITENGSYTISGSSTKSGVIIGSGVTANVTLAGVSINISNSYISTVLTASRAGRTPRATHIPPIRQ